MTRRIEARSLHVYVSSHHPLADEQVAEVIARVLSRYAFDFTPGVEVNVPHDGGDVTYVASVTISVLSCTPRKQQARFSERGNPTPPNEVIE